MLNICLLLLLKTYYQQTAPDQLSALLAAQQKLEGQFNDLTTKTAEASRIGDVQKAIKLDGCFSDLIMFSAEGFRRSAVRSGQEGCGRCSKGSGTPSETISSSWRLSYNL